MSLAPRSPHVTCQCSFKLCAMHKLNPEIGYITGYMASRKYSMGPRHRDESKRDFCSLQVAATSFHFNIILKNKKENWNTNSLPNLNQGQCQGPLMALLSQFPWKGGDHLFHLRPGFWLTMDHYRVWPLATKGSLVMRCCHLRPPCMVRIRI